MRGMIPSAMRQSPGKGITEVDMPESKHLKKIRTHVHPVVIMLASEPIRAGQMVFKGKYGMAERLHQYGPIERAVRAMGRAKGWARWATWHDRELVGIAIEDAKPGQTFKVRKYGKRRQN